VILIRLLSPFGSWTTERRITRRKYLGLSLGLMSASLLASPALAQVSVDVGGSAGVDAGADVSGSGTGTAAGTGVDTDVELRTGAQADTDADAGVDPGTTAAVGGSFDSAISAMVNNSAAAGSISSMTEVRLVKVIRISDLEGADMDALLSAETENRATIDELQSSIEGNATVMAALEAEAVDPEDIVAAEVAADGSITVYVR
jgi:hypothetical protein